jgi:FKBP-type peptidyl-prolyl cis-trans isomerase (trigger factor)
MKSIKITLAFILTALLTFTACNRDPFDGIPFSRSERLDEFGYWEGVNATRLVTLFDYMNFPIPAHVHQVSEVDVMNEIFYLINEYGYVDVVMDRPVALHDVANIDFLGYMLEVRYITDRPVAAGDVWNADFTGTLDGAPFPGGTATDYIYTAPSGTFTDNFNAHIIGRSPGETLTFTLSLPDNYPEADLRGKEAVFTVTINHIVTEVWEAFAGGTEVDYDYYVSEGVFIDNFHEQVIGRTPGEMFEVRVMFPLEYHNVEMRGVQAKFDVYVNYILEEISPQMTDEFVAKYIYPDFGWSTLDEMKAEIEREIQRFMIYMHIQEFMETQVRVRSIPRTMMRYQERASMNTIHQMAEMYAASVEEVLEVFHSVTSIKDYLTSINDENTAIARQNLIMQAIAEDLGLRLTRDDVDVWMRDNMGTTDYSHFEQDFGMPYIVQVVMLETIMDMIIDNVVLQ